jgi:hypothetical protein
MHPFDGEHSHESIPQCRQLFIRHWFLFTGVVFSEKMEIRVVCARLPDDIWGGEYAT